MKKGGETKQLPPIYVNDPNSKRLQAYNDSLLMHNKGAEYLRDAYRSGTNIEEVQVQPGETHYDYRGNDVHSGNGNYTTPEHPYKSFNINRTSILGLYPIPKQPIVYQEQLKPTDPYISRGAHGELVRIPQRSVKKLPITQPAQLPTDIPQQQLQQREIPDFREEVWQSPNVINGKLVQPAGFYKQGIQYKKGGSTKWLNKFK